MRRRGSRGRGRATQPGDVAIIVVHPGENVLCRRNINIIVYFFLSSVCCRSQLVMCNYCVALLLQCEVTLRNITAITKQVAFQYVYHSISTTHSQKSRSNLAGNRNQHLLNSFHSFAKSRGSSNYQQLKGHWFKKVIFFLLFKDF